MALTLHELTQINLKLFPTKFFGQWSTQKYFMSFTVLPYCFLHATVDHIQHQENAKYWQNPVIANYPASGNIRWVIKRLGKTDEKQRMLEFIQNISHDICARTSKSQEATSDFIFILHCNLSSSHFPSL